MQTFIGDEGAKIFASEVLAKCEKVTHLFVANCKITAKGLGYIFAALPKTVEVLDVSDNDFGDEGESSSATATAERDSAEDGEPSVPNNARAFAELPSLPEDLSSVFEDLKLAVLRHKVTNWQAVQPSEIRAHLDAIQTLLG